MATPVNRGQVWKNFINQPAAPVPSQDQFWANMCKWISAGKVVPVISGSLVYDHIFKALVGEGGGENEACAAPKINALNALAMIWASRVPYPLPDSMDMARVAQFVRSKSKSVADARQSFLDFLKGFLIEYAAQMSGDPNQFAHLQNSLDEYSFSELAMQELAVANFGPGCTDPISILASLPLPVYITTSFHDVLEQTLIAFGKEPISQVCFWSGPQPSAPEYTQIEQFSANPQKPLVYHLYGMDRYPLTLVLSEDDYLDFLVRITADQGKVDSILPSYLINAFKLNLLIMLGYRMYDWDFRTLFRGIISARERQDMTFTNTIIQLSLTDQYTLLDEANIRESLNQVQDYMQDYFNPLAFEIRWNDPNAFLGALQKEWKDRRQK